jgi:DNA-binding response OmpR family regulator
MIVAGGFHLVGRELVVAERRVALTGSEAGLLACLLAAGPRVVSRAELTKALWGVQSHDTGRAVDTHIHRLRQKLAGIPGITIATIRRRGFRLDLGAQCA